MLDIFMRQGEEIREIYQVYRRILHWLKKEGLGLENIRELAPPGEFLTVDQGVCVPALKLKVCLSFYIPEAGNVGPGHREFDTGFVILVVELEDDDGPQGMNWFSNKGGYAHRTTLGGTWLDTQGDELRDFARRRPDFMLDLVKRAVTHLRK